MIDHSENYLSDPDDHVEGTVNSVFLQHALKVSLVTALALLPSTIIFLGSRVIGVIALWHVPRWAVGFLAAVLALDVAWTVLVIRRRGRDKEPSRWASMPSRPTLSVRIRRASWWGHRVIAVSYLACIIVVLKDWYNLPIALAVASACLVVTLLLNQVLQRTGGRVVMLDAFAKANMPKNNPGSPEV